MVRRTGEEAGVQECDDGAAGALPGRVHDGEQRAQNAQVHRGVERIHGEQLIVPGTFQKVESYGNR